jgi:hypothetical protein
VIEGEQNDRYIQIKQKKTYIVLLGQPINTVTLVFIKQVNLHKMIVVDEESEHH